MSQGCGRIALHALALLDVKDSCSATLTRAAASCLPVTPATEFWPVGDVEKLRVKYENSETLLLRDAGCVLRTMTLAAEYGRSYFAPKEMLRTARLLPQPEHMPEA